MRLDSLKRTTCTVHEILRTHLQKGDIVVDATCGNGNDCKVMLELVGPGKVYALDIQKQAIDKTGQLDSDNLLLFLKNHKDLDEVIAPEDKGRIKAVVYNLGYLPGSDKTVKTNKEDLIASLKRALDLLCCGGIILISCYAHKEGKEEFQALEEFCSTLSGVYDSYLFYRLNRKDVPKLLLITKS